jgi:hypothetical protein
MKKSWVSLLLIALLLLMSVRVVVAQEEEPTWEMERPSYEVNINQRTENSYSDGEASVGLGVHVAGYQEDYPGTYYDGDDGVELRIAATANTREAINYEFDISDNPFDPWFSPPFGDVLNLGDNEGAWVNLPIGRSVAFYSGPGSLYTKVWVCSNGFLSFDSNSTSTSADPRAGPDLPNAFIAPYWSDLDPTVEGAVISYRNNSMLGNFVVSWYNVLDKSNNMRQSFEVVIQPHSDSYPRKQNIFAFQYRSVSWSSEAMVGLEDQRGNRGWLSHGGPVSGSIVFSPQNAYDVPAIREMSIMVEKQGQGLDDKARILIGTDFDHQVRGRNLRLESTTPMGTDFLEKALGGYYVLLLSTTLGEICPLAGLIIDGAVLFFALISEASESCVPLGGLTKVDAYETQNVALLKAPALGDDPSNWPVDALLGSAFYWVFTDNNDRDHSIKITAKLTYFSYTTNQNETITTSVNLNIWPDAGDNLASANQVTPGKYLAHVFDIADPDDYFMVTVPAHKYIYSFLRPIGGVLYADLYLYSASGTLLSLSDMPGNATEFVWAYASSTTNYYIRVNAADGLGLYDLEICVSDQSPGCPFVYSWNGQNYVLDNNLLPASTRSSGTDVEDFYKLEQSTIPIHQNPLFSLYPLQIREFQTEHSYLDQVKLFAVDHQPDVNIAVAQDGEILTYKNPHPPISCTNKYGYNMLDRIQYIDQDYYQGYPSDYLTLDFGNLNVQESAKLVMRADMEHIKDSIHVQILNATGEWQTIAKIIPRVYWATEIINLAPYLLNSTGNLQIRLYFTAYHKLDYVGLDTTPQADITTRQSLLISATHSEKGLITLKLLCNDQIYAELIPDQQINLLFALPQKQNQTTSATFIFYTDGHYNTIK